jgi:hypothetical protein
MKTAKLTTLLSTAIVVIGMSMISMTTAIAAEVYDLVILNGRVMNPESMFDGVRNVGIKDGRIVTIT